MTSSGIELPTTRLVAQCLSQLRYHVAQIIIIRGISNVITTAHLYLWPIDSSKLSSCEWKKFISCVRWQSRSWSSVLLLEEKQCQVLRRSFDWSIWLFYQVQYLTTNVADFFITSQVFPVRYFWRRSFFLTNFLFKFQWNLELLPCSENTY
jgi:hypothetical protein